MGACPLCCACCFASRLSSSRFVLVVLHWHKHTHTHINCIRSRQCGVRLFLVEGAIYSFLFLALYSSTRFCRSRTLEHKKDDLIAYCSHVQLVLDRFYSFGDYLSFCRRSRLTHVHCMEIIPARIFQFPECYLTFRHQSLDRPSQLDYTNVGEAVTTFESAWRMHNTSASNVSNRSN